MDISLKNDLFDKIKNQIDSSLFEITSDLGLQKDIGHWREDPYGNYRSCSFESKQKINSHSGRVKNTIYEDSSLAIPEIRIEPIIEGSIDLDFDIIFVFKFTPNEIFDTKHKPGWFSNKEIKLFKTEIYVFSVMNQQRYLSKKEQYDRCFGLSEEEKRSLPPSGEKINFKDLTILKYGEKPFNELEQDYIDFFKKFDIKMTELLKEVYEGVNEFKNEINNVLVDLDQDNNGQLDFIEGGDDYLTLLKKHQSKIVEIDRTYIQQFIKVSNYLTQKKQNLQVIFERLKDSVNQSQLDELGEILKQEIHTYNIILLNSLHMINSLVEDDMITFYDIYEKFDKLNMFTSNWENQVTEKLDEVNLNLVELMKELRDVGERIVGSIDNLSYITEESTRQLTSKMEEIDSTLKVGNFINVIQTYQMYKVNKNTKSLRE